MRRHSGDKFGAIKPQLSPPERNFPETRIGFDQDVPVCSAAFSPWRVISLPCHICCGFGEVILKMDLKEIGQIKHSCIGWEGIGD